MSAGSRAPVTFEWLGEITDRDRADFWSRVEMHSGVRACWEWRGAKRNPEKNKYGRFAIRGRGVLAHRMAYRLAYDADPGPLLVLHNCDNDECVNPRHLRLGTQVDNGRDVEIASVMEAMFRNGVKRPGRAAVVRKQPRLRTVDERKKYVALLAADGTKIDRRRSEYKNHKITTEAVQLLRADYWRGGLEAEALAVTYGIDTPLALRILCRESFSALPVVVGEPSGDARVAVYAARGTAYTEGKRAAALRAWATRRARGNDRGRGRLQLQHLREAA